MNRADAGFTTLELLVAMALTVVVVGAALELASADAFAVQSEMSDMHQRVRVAASTVIRDLSAASAVRPVQVSWCGRRSAGNLQNGHGHRICADRDGHLLAQG